MFVWVVRILLFLALGVCFYFDMPWYTYLVLAVSYFTVMITSAFRPEWQVFLPLVQNQADRSVALTFDDGPHPETTPALLKLLLEHEAKATFFLVGARCEQYPNLVRDIHEAGHTIANHSMTHDYLISFSTVTRWREEIQQCEAKITEITRDVPALFRPPYGVTTPGLARAIRNLPLTTIGWSVHGKDWFGSVDQIEAQLSTISEGDIVLLHDSRPNTIIALERWLEQNRCRFKFDVVKPRVL